MDREKSMMHDQQLHDSPRRKVAEKPPAGRTRSLSAETLADRSPTTPSHAALPFEPASAMIAAQKSRPTVNKPASSVAGMQKTQSHHGKKDETNTGSGSDHDTYQLPAIFRPRPLVTALSLQHPRRCATYPIDSHIEKQLSSPPPKLPDWLMPDTREKSFPPFPISINLPTDGRRWWIREMAGISKRRPSDTVQEGAVEIELVESGDSLEDVIEEFQVEVSIATDKTDCITPHPKVLNEKMIKTDTAPTANQRYSFCDRANLQEKFKLLRAEMDQSKEMDSEKKRQMEQLLKQIEGAIDMDETNSDSAAEQNKTQPNESTPGAVDHIRRIKVATAGGALTVAGVVLVPCPIIPGCLVIYGGLMVLASEFDGAKKVLDVVREPLEKLLADDVEFSKTCATNDERYSSFLWEEIIGYNPDECHWCKKEIDGEFMAILESAKMNKSDEKNPADGRTDLKPFLRKILMLDSAPEGGNTK